MEFLPPIQCGAKGHCDTPTKKYDVGNIVCLFFRSHLKGKKHAVGKNG